MEVYVIYCKSDKQPMLIIDSLFRVFKNKEDAENFVSIMNAIEKTDVYVQTWEVKKLDNFQKEDKDG